MAKRRKIRPIDLSETVQKLLEEYGEDVYSVMDESVKEVSDEATEKLRAVNHWKNDGSGAYAGSWVNDKMQSTRVKSVRVVHNEDHYRLTHLLENGHVIRNGTGRTFGRTGKYPHIAPVNDWANKELPNVVKRKVGRL